jgi:hypothetical protein
MIESQGLPKIHSCQPLTKHPSTAPSFQAAGCALHTHKQVLNPMWPPVFMMRCSSGENKYGDWQFTGHCINQKRAVSGHPAKCSQP